LHIVETAFSQIVVHGQQSLRFSGFAKNPCALHRTCDTWQKYVQKGMQKSKMKQVLLRLGKYTNQ
jgi:hypothetical protein